MKGEFYKMDFRAWNIGTVDLTLEQEGAYLRLINAMYDAHGPIPASTRFLQGPLRCGNIKAVALVEQLVKAGKIQRTADGMLTNRRVEVELAGRARLSEVRRLAAGGGARERRMNSFEEGGDDRVNAEGITSDPEVTLECASGGTEENDSKSLKSSDTLTANAQASESRGDKRREENTPVVPKGTEDGFERFKAAYPKRSTTFPIVQARKRYTEAIRRGADPSQIEAGARAYAAEQVRNVKIGTKYVKTADVWLKEERWGDYRQPAGEAASSLTGEGYLARLTDDQWRDHLRRWKSTGGAWPLANRTPAPDSPRTKVPKHILDEFGIRTERIAVQNDGELARNRHAGPRHGTALGDLQAPGGQARPFAATRQQRMGRLVERAAGQLVAAAADLALDVGLARLVAKRCQAEMGPDVPGLSEPLRLIDGGAEGQRSDQADARHAHPSPADRLAAHDNEDLPGQPVELLPHRGQDRQQRRDERQDQGIVAHHLLNMRGKDRPSRRAELDPAVAQDCPHHVPMGRISLSTVRCATSSERQSRD